MPNEFSLETVAVALSPRERFEEFLQSRGKRFTQQREILVEHVFSRHEHFDADELMDELTKSQGARRVSRPTVYRTLRELVDSGLLRKMQIGSRAVYEHDYGYPQHDHLHCQQCNQLIEFHSDELKHLRDAVARENRFRVTGHRFIITGICNDCAHKVRRKKRPVDLI